MAIVLTEALKSSTAHGISHAMATKNYALKVMYLTAFVVFLCLFTYYGVSLLLKVREQTWTRDYDYDAEEFMFPDLYFCPTNPVSGSFPFTLNETEAAVINEELRRISQLYEDFAKRSPEPEWKKNTYLKALMMLKSVRQSILTHFIAQQLQQSLPVFVLLDGVMAKDKSAENFYHPKYINCFKPNMTDVKRSELNSPDKKLVFWLLADVYFPDYENHPEHGYTGARIDPIKADGGKDTMYVQRWPVGASLIRTEGFNMIIVPPNTYPSDVGTTNILLEPGHAYEVKLKMRTYEFDPKLRNQHCESTTEQTRYIDPVTRLMQNFSYSWSDCYHIETSKWMIDKVGCVPSSFPQPWEYRGYPRCFNLTESDYRILDLSLISQMQDVDRVARQKCRYKMPPRYQHYIPDYSFSNWAKSSTTLGDLFTDFSLNDNAKKMFPALHRIKRMGLGLESGNASVNTKKFFRNYISENMMQVTVSGVKPNSTKIILKPAYTLEQFLADAGGLLGLYIGCSLLTLLELVELVYNVTVALLASRRSHGAADKQDEGDNSTAGQLDSSGEADGNGDFHEHEMRALRSDDCAAAV